MEQQIGCYFDNPPWHYDKGEEVKVVFRTDRDVLASILPPVLELPDGPGTAVLSAVHHLRSSFGPYIGVYLGMIATFDGEPVLHRLTGMKSSFSGTVGGREVWGMPLATGEPTMAWDGDVLNIVARRQGKDFAQLTVRLERRIQQPASGIKHSTSIARRPPWENAEKMNVLLGSRGEPADPKDMTYWTGSSVLKLVGGDPGDDWSILPVQQIVETTYNVGGHSALTGAYVLKEF